MSVRIRCINKAAGDHYNPYMAISHLGWICDQDQSTGKSTRLAMYDFVYNGNLAYVQDARGDKAPLKAYVSSNGTKYVATQPDYTTLDNLLRLPECVG